MTCQNSPHDEQLMWGIKNGDMELVKRLLVESKSELSRPPLHLAADAGQVEILQFLVDNGENVNELDVHGISPLLAAVWENRAECVEFLISQGADKSLVYKGQKLTDILTDEQTAIKELLS